MLKLLWLLTGFAALGFALYLAAEEGQWRRQRLVQRFAAYLQTNDGTCHPILSEETVVGRSKRLSDLVISVPGARTEAQQAELKALSGCHLEILHRDNAFLLRNLQTKRCLSLCRPGCPTVLSLAPCQELPLCHGDEIRLTPSLSLWFYKGEVM